MPVRVPEAVVLREELHAAAVVVVLSELAVDASSSFAQDPRIAKILPIDTIKKITFFIYFSFDWFKYQNQYRD